MNTPTANEIIEGAEWIFTFAPPHSYKWDSAHPGLHRTEDGRLCWVDTFDPDRAIEARLVTHAEALRLLAERIPEAIDSTFEAYGFADFLREAGEQIPASPTAPPGGK